MEFTQIKEKIKRTVKKIVAKQPLLKECIGAIAVQGGKSYLVGGGVRDLLLGIPLKDLDIEVYGLTIERLEAVLKQFGHVRTVGKVFGVLRLDGLDVDWSLPRVDSAGRRPAVQVDPFMSVEKAFRRRDLTINALGINLDTLELVDPFNGLQDLQKKVLRTPDATFFVQDPLRLFRVMQFIGRFDMHPNKELETLCKTMDISEVSRERIEQEFAKLLLKSEQPSKGIRWLHAIGRLQKVIPEIAALEKVPQRPDYHPEGDVFEHAMQAVDAAAQMDYADDQDKLISLWAALLHDIGKLETTENIEGVWKSLGHAEAGGPLARKTLRRLTNNKVLLDTVEKLIYHHMDPLNFIRTETKPAAYKRLASKLHPHTTIAHLAKLWHADRRGRNAQRGSKPLEGQDKEVELFIKRAYDAGVLHGPEQPVLIGKDLLGLVEPGPVMGQVLKKAYDIQIEKGITDKKELKKRALQGIVTD